MNGPSLQSGDLVDVTVMKTAPFGVLVETPAGIPGLVLDAVAEPGAVLRVRVSEYDSARRRFSAALG